VSSGRLPESPAAARNRGPILEVLRAWLPERARVLEVGCGTGQHAAFFAREMAGVDWQPSDRDDALFDAVRGWAREEGVEARRAPVRLDVTDDAAWPAGPFDAVFSANLIHIAPWEACQGLLRGAGRVLREGGLLLLYGPFRVEGHTAPSNEAFDADLRARDPRYGVRDLEAVAAEAASHGLVVETQIPLPANNRVVVLRRRA